MSTRHARKVLLIGWDAADWEVIYPLLQAGQLPCMQRLIATGVRANLQTLSPMMSPLLWTSIATGMRADKHGILNFVEPDPKGSGIRPVTSTSRKVKTIWNILTQQGLRTHVVGWFASHPAEPINGVCVSNQFAVAVGRRTDPRPLAAGTVHPAELQETLAKLRVHPGEVSPKQMLPFLPRFADIDPTDRRIMALAIGLAECSSIHQAVLWILQNQTWDFLAAYFNAIDYLSHYFMRYHPPRREEISEQDFEFYKDVINGTYRYHDYMLAQILPLAGPETTVVLASDHGFQCGQERQRCPADASAKEALGWHRKIGVLCMAGPSLKKSAVVTKANLLDITPTILTLFGLPVGDDMEGRALVEAFNQPVKPERIPSWEQVPGDSGRHPPGLEQESWESKEALKQLADLGYISMPDGNDEGAVRVARLQEKLNLALVHMEAGRPTQAIGFLEELIREEPKEPAFVLFLAKCRLALEEFGEGRRLVESVLERDRESQEAKMILEELAAKENASK
jgi:hypothetical protein